MYVNSMLICNIVIVTTSNNYVWIAIIQYKLQQNIIKSSSTKTQAFQYIKI